MGSRLRLFRHCAVLCAVVAVQACTLVGPSANPVPGPTGSGSGGDRTAPPVLPEEIERIPDAVPTQESKTRSGNPRSYTQFGVEYRVLDTSKGYEAEGVASWYGPGFHGKRTSSGETYDQNAMTAAHTVLPLPTYVEVTNLDNGRFVIVRINDRGPFSGGRIIDLSYAAAKHLGFINQGTAKVRVTYIRSAKRG